nr:MAG: ADP-ribosyltransferase [Bacteriophage sp.]
MAKGTKVNDIDITKSGPMTFRDLQRANQKPYTNLSPEFQSFSMNVGANTAPTSLYDARAHGEQMVQSSLEGTATPWGESIFDEPTATEAQFQELGDIRAENQPWYAQIGAGLAKGAILAGTTFLDGTVGLIFGAKTAIDEDRWSGLWDNDFSKAMQSVNEWSEQALPNYYTRAEQEQPWYENIFTANFLGDKFIKNLGFTVGAFYSGGVTAAGLKATKLPQLIGAIAKSSKAPAIVNSAVGATISAVNEGRIEALNNSKDWFELHKAQLDDTYRDRVQAIQNRYEDTKGTLVRTREGQMVDPAYIEYQNAIKKEQESYNAALGKLSEDRLKMGNADLLMNIPILTASNIIQFGKLYANGFKTARKATNIVGKAGEYTAGTTRLGATAAITKGALSEGTEEITQGMASRISGNYYSTDVNNFYKSKTDPEAAQETLSWTKSFAEGINETVNDGSAWEEFFIGSLTGALGMPRFRGVRSESGSLQSPITIEGGAINEWRDYNEKIARENEIANYMNSRINSPEFKNYYQGLIRHNKYQNDMNIAAEEGDEFNFKNAEHAQLVSDIAMFDNAGKMEDLTTLIDAAFDTSDENLASIVENTTTTLEDGSKVGPFVDKNGNPMYATPEGKQEMIEKLQQNHDEMTNTINNYLKIKDDLDIKTGQQLSDDQLEELTWMKSQIGNWAERATSMSGEVKSAIGNVIGNLDSLLKFNQQVRDFEGQSHADLTDRYKQADKNVRAIEGAINTLNMVRGQDDKVLAHTLATNPKFVDGLIKEINEVDETVLSADEKEDITTKLNDIVKLGNASKTYNAKLKEYLDNPQKQAEDHARADEQAAQQETKKKSDDLKASLNAAQNLQEFRSTIDAQDDIENRDRVLKELEDGGSEMAKNYRETSQYNNEVRRVLNESDAEPQVKQDAMKLLQDQFSNSENLEQLANPNSIYINNENAFDEDSEGDVELSATRFQEAQYELQKAMSQVNNDNRFKDRFSPEYKKPVEKREGTVRGDDRTTTGDSGTSTTPTVTSSEGLPTTELPVGNITAEMVNEENKKANERVETPQRPSRDTSNQFYRPAIPELHIEASKEGDFRPFDIVVGEREKGVDFSGIYGYLRDSGAFRYLNEGNLKAGDELGFMIDPSFNDHTIFIIDKRNGQVVGSLDESDYSVSRYEGLKGLEEKIRGEYANRQDKTGKFIATPVTKVSKVMVGRIPYGNTERSLSEIPNVSSTDRKPIFGIIKNGVLTTNSKIDDSLIIKPVDMSQKEGRLYLLIPNGAGKYSPAAVRVKHFNNEEFNLNDSSVSSTPVGEDINNAITKLSTATSQDDVSAAMQDLAQDLYMQDIMVTWFSSKAGDGIVISKKVRKPDGTYEKVTINGKEQIKEDKYDVYFSTSSKSAEIGGINFDATALEDLGDTSALGTPKNPEDIYNEILGHLIKFNLPLQVSTRRINEGAYNNRLINSNILTSNITEASVRSTWFTTDYFDNEGNLHQAISPASVAPQPKRKIETPVGGTEGAIAGTRIASVSSNKPYYVDLKTNTIRDNQGKTVEVTDSNRILFDLAWAQDNFGDSTNSSMMVDNKVLTPDGKVLDRSKQVYLSGQDAQDVKDTIAGRKKEREDRVAKSKEVVSEIYENQKRVDKTRTDGEFYYVLEDDGEYHQYSRVHSRLGSNWVESDKQTKALELARLNLSKFVDNPTQYENYLKYLENKFKVDLTAYRGKTDAKNRDTIVNIVRDKMSGTNSQRALDAGSAVDSIIRQYFTIRDVSKIARPSNMSENAFIDLITSLNRIKSNMEQMGERFLADNIVLFQKYSDGTRVAGEVDILSIDKDGNFRIYDVKTSRYSFYDFTDRYGHKVNYFTTPSATQRMSAKDYYTLQLSAYKNLFESQYGVPVTKLAVMPFVLSYDKENVSSVQSEKGIPIAYNPAVNVPLASAVKVNKSTETPATPAQAQTVLPIFETSLETQNPIEDLTPEHSMNNADEGVGYFELEGKLHKGYLTPIAGITEVDVHITKVPNITKGFGRQGEAAHVASNNYYAVFPNGKTFLLIRNNPVQGGMSESQVEDSIRKALLGNPQRMRDLASEKTILFDPDAVPTVSTTPITTVETPATINQGNTQTGAAYTAQKEQAINDHDEEFEDVLTLRKAKDTTETPVWNQEKELRWLNKVLPQLSEQDRVKVVKGLIKVGKRGTLAWGQFDKGVITLSDIAAEGTAYHEAFHTVFNLLLDNGERQALYDEARKLYGEKDNLSLEEDMAEGFREYVTTRQNARLLDKIKNFFKDLWIKVTNWNSVRPHLTAYYQMINRGEYSNRELPVETLSQAKARQEEYSKEMQDILANAKRDSEGNLLAPNGKKSNLTERQYAQVRTKAFKDWFGDWENNPDEASKIVDENGEPLVVYHNTPFEFNGIFDMDHKSRIMPWTSEPFGHVGTQETANTIKGTQFALFLNVKNPLETPDFVHETVNSMLSELYKQGIISREKYSSLRGISNSELRNLMLSLGYDGTKYENKAERGGTSYSFITPNQIKSATDNVGTFSRTDDDIRYREVPNSSFESLDTEMQENLLKKGWTAEKFDSISQEERDQAIKCIAF